MTRQLIKRMFFMLLFLGVLFFLIFGFGAFRNYEIGKFMATLSNPSQTVSTFKAVATPWQTSLSSVGSVVAINGADLSAEVSGIVDSINFQSGADVKQGALLLRLRPNNDNAVLAQLQATAALNKVTYNRDVKQFHADAIAQSQVDTDRANLAAATAQVQAQQALMDEKIVQAPFSGRLGIRQVDIGQYLTAGTQIVTLQQLNPMFFDFYLPQQALARIGVGQAITVSTDAFPDKTFAGKISAINSAVDVTTRNVQVRATIQNDALLLRPGMFGTVSIAVGQPQNLVTVPQTVISYNSYGDTAYIVTHAGTPASPAPASGAKAGGPTKTAGGGPALSAHQVFITVGDTRGDQVAVTSGIAAGDEVVSSGQLKLKNGSPITINNSVQPANNPNPNPPNE